MNANNIKTISNRISVLQEPSFLSIVILPVVQKIKLALLFVWLLLWTISGIVIINYYFKITVEKQKIVYIVWLCFWLYFELKIGSVLLWKKFGKEKIWIKNGIIHIQQSIGNKGKIETFAASFVNKIEAHQIDPKKITAQFYNTFWVRGGERIEISYQAKKIKFAQQITDTEVNQVLNLLNKYITLK